MNGAQTYSAYAKTRRYSIDGDLTEASIPSRALHPVRIFCKKLVDVGGDGMVRDRCTDQLHFFFNQLARRIGDGMADLGRDGRCTLFHAHLCTMHMAYDQCSYYPIVLGYVEPMYWPGTSSQPQSSKSLYSISRHCTWQDQCTWLIRRLVRWPNSCSSLPTMVRRNNVLVHA
jgi:hypothetical protein